MGNPHRDRQRRQQRGSNEEYRNNSFSDAFQRRYGSIDVSVDGIAPQRHDRGRSDRGGDRPRQKLEFREVACLEQGDCRCRITVAEGHQHPIYNFTVERQNRERPSRFFRDGDVDDLKAILVQAADWIADARSRVR